MIDKKQEVKVAIEVIRAVADAIRELKQVPSGHLYVRLMPMGFDLEKYNQVIGILKNTGLVKEENFILTWIGPA